MKIPTPREFETVYLLKKEKRDSRASRREARYQLRRIGRGLRRGRLEVVIDCNEDPEARNIVREKLAAADWDVRWGRVECGSMWVTVSAK